MKIIIPEQIKGINKVDSLVLPILEENKLKIYKVNKKEEFENYITDIKEEYGSRDEIENENDVTNGGNALPLSLHDNGIQYDVLSCVIENIEEIDPYRIGGVRKCASFSELFYYPKLYVILKNTFDDDIIRLNYLTEYLIDAQSITEEEKNNLKEELKDSRKKRTMKRQEMNMIMSKYSDNEVLTAEELKQELEGLKELFSIELKEIYEINGNNISINVNLTKEEFEKIKEYFYVGLQNKKSIEFIEEQFNKEKPKQYKR